MSNFESAAQTPIGARFICKLPPRGKALMEVVHLYSHDPKKQHLVCCRIVQGTLIDDHGKPFGPGCSTDLPLNRVAAAISRYEAKKLTALASE